MDMKHLFLMPFKTKSSYLVFFFFFLVNNDNFIELKTKKTQKGVREKLFIYIFNKSSKRDKRDEMRSPSQTKKDPMSNVVRQFIEGLGTKMKPKLAKKMFYFMFLGQTWLLWLLFEKWIDSKSSFSKTIFGQKSSFVKTTFMSHFKKIYLKVVFTKDDFHVFFEFKKNLVKSRLL